MPLISRLSSSFAFASFAFFSVKSFAFWSKCEIFFAFFIYIVFFNLNIKIDPWDNGGDKRNLINKILMKMICFPSPFPAPLPARGQAVKYTPNSGNFGEIFYPEPRYRISSKIVPL
jgi:hypothetical protein